MQSGLNIEHVSVRYRNGLEALSDANLALPPGSITALVGVNGSGKSTLFKSIMGFVKLSAGKVTFNNVPMAQALKANQVAYVPQSEEIDWQFPVLVEDVVMMGRYGHMNFLRRAKQRDRDLVRQALTRVGMWSCRQRQIGELSGGQKKRVFLARALAQQAQLILLDEPFTGVDVTTEEQIMALLRELRQEGKMILVATHNLGSVPEFCDRAALIKQRIIAAGLTEQVFTHQNLQHTFGGVLRHFILAGKELHEDEDTRKVTVISDCERPVVMYDQWAQTPLSRQQKLTAITSQSEAQP
ncbi:manganese/iron ABC transporter ATP-binding protein [Motilimonas pumila]|uniref:Manganese/iron ABC transporter ATP-binding protein n=1 Tax=Motilimonas pumila TaxID=2303987 RepID=A0A418YD30_9GAMM|nr:manganese/iron ABC transporter ATP-binding protein [Motilimonas pumila]RJG42438.1 manganese/iron ABC transporter ATP-binding protein [Motilimonas pumila]